jgi:hypothetical protein
MRAPQGVQRQRQRQGLLLLQLLGRRKALRLSERLLASAAAAARLQGPVEALLQVLVQQQAQALQLLGIGRVFGRISRRSQSLQGRESPPELRPTARLRERRPRTALRLRRPLAARHVPQQLLPGRTSCYGCTEEGAVGRRVSSTVG